MGVDIFVARHGQNVDNVNNVLNGHRDLPLTEIGRQQAYELGLGIKAAGLMFDAVYTSPLSRAVETAEIAARVAGLPNPERMADLIERDFGELTGRPIPEVLEICTDNLFPTDHVTYVLEGYGFEPFEVALDRAKGVIGEMRANHADHKVLLVCHGDIGKMLYAAATERSIVDVLKNFHFGNGDLINVKADTAHVIKVKQAGNL